MMTDDQATMQHHAASEDTAGGKSLTRGLLAGVVGGLVAMAARSLVEKAMHATMHTITHGEAEMQGAGARSHAGYGLGTASGVAPDTASMATAAIPWRFGAAIGAVYGAVAEYVPAATDKEGASFGMALATMTQKGMLPGLHLEPTTAAGIVTDGSSDDESPGEQATEIASYIVFGVVTETVRRFVRKLL